MLVRNVRFTRFLVIFAPHILILLVWSMAAVFLHMAGHHPEALGFEPNIIGRWSELMRWSDVGIPFGAIGALGGALAIFLGFRNQSAYDRWWEARKIWGALVNDSRSWARQVLAWVQAPEGASDPDAEVAALKKELIDRHLAFVHGLGLHLRKLPELTTKVAEYVSPAEAQHYERVPNVPTALLFEQGRRVARAREEGRLEHFRHLAMDELLTRLSDIQGKCERIKNTPLPQQFNQFPRWFVYVYCAILPLSLAELIGWGGVPLSVVIGVMFLALELSGRAIEDPFENLGLDTPMTALSVTIERDLKAALGEALPEPIQPNERGALL